MPLLRLLSCLLPLWLLAVVLPVRAGLPELVEATKPSIVAIGTYDPLGNPRFSFRGTGFAVGDGTLVVTNAHVLPPDDEKPAARLVVAVPRGGGQPDLRAARLVQGNPARDLALLKIDGAALPPLVLGDSTAVREGQSIALIGFPLGAGLGLSPVTHRGIVSAVTAIALPAPTSRQLDAKTAMALRGGPTEIFQLDATAYPGNSGSPVLDADTGKVIGVVNLVFVKGTKESAISHPTGITYAVPGRHVVDMLGAR